LSLNIHEHVKRVVKQPIRCLPVAAAVPALILGRGVEGYPPPCVGGMVPALPFFEIPGYPRVVKIKAHADCRVTKFDTVIIWSTGLVFRRLQWNSLAVIEGVCVPSVFFLVEMFRF